MAVPSSPITVHRARNRVGSSLPGRAVWRGRRLHCLIPALNPVLRASCPPQCPFWWHRREDPTPVPHSATPAAPRSITSHPPQGSASGCQVAPKIWGQTSPRPSGRAVGSEAAGGRLAPGGSVGAKHLRDGSTHSATRSPSPPHSPCTPDLGMCLGRAPGPRPGQRRAVTVTRGSLFIVTNRRN